MPGLQDARQYHGPNGPNNYISDNPRMVFTRNVNDCIIQIDLFTVLNVNLRKTITRDVNDNITNISRWVRI